MLKIKDLGINALPRGYRMTAGCDGQTEYCGDESGLPPECKGCTATDFLCAACSATAVECAECTATGRPGYYRSAGFTDDAVALLRQQLDDRMGPQLGD